MRKRIFECVQDEEYGELGWREVGKGKDGFNALGARAVAHDIFEHFPDDNGEMHHEFMAQGAALWICWQDGAFNSPSIGTRTFVHETRYLFHQLFMEGEAESRYLAPFPRGQRPLSDEYLEADLQELIREGIKSFKAEDREVTESLGDDELRSYVTNAVAWIREGYRRVQRRYRGQSSGHIYGLFTMVVERMKAEEMIEGKRIEIYVNPDRNIVRVEEVYEPEYAY